MCQAGAAPHAPSGALTATSTLAVMSLNAQVEKMRPREVHELTQSHRIKLGSSCSITYQVHWAEGPQLDGSLPIISTDSSSFRKLTPNLEARQKDIHMTRQRDTQVLGAGKFCPKAKWLAAPYYNLKTNNNNMFLG